MYHRSIAESSCRAGGYWPVPATPVWKPGHRSIGDRLVASDRRIGYPTLHDGRHLDSSSAKRADGADPADGHEAGASRAPHRAFERASVPRGRPIASGRAGPGLPRPPQGRVRARLLLASAFRLPPCCRAVLPQDVLVAETGQKPGARPDCTISAATFRVARPCPLGM